MMALMAASNWQEEGKSSAPLREMMRDSANHFLIRSLSARCLPGWRRPAALAAARALADSATLDWQQVYRRAVEERVAPLLYTVLGEEAFVPPAVRQQLREAYLALARHNLFLFNELQQALAALNNAGIDVLVLKGGALAETVYGNIAVRPLLDFDLLVRRERAVEAIDALNALGYERATIEPHVGIALRHENEVLMYKQGQIEVRMELHWSLFDSPHYQDRLPMEWFWESATTGSVAGRQTPVLGAEAQLLHLCGHLMLHHRGDELLWLHDIAELLYAYEGRITWSQVLEKAAAWDLILPLKQVISSVAAEWQAPVPADVLARLDRMTPSRAEEQVFSWLTGERRPVLERFWADLATMPNWTERLSYALRQLFPSYRYMRHRYAISHPLLLPFYYPYRWWLGLYRSIVGAVDE